MSMPNRRSTLRVWMDRSLGNIKVILQITHRFVLEGEDPANEQLASYRFSLVIFLNLARESVITQQTFFDRLKKMTSTLSLPLPCVSSLPYQSASVHL